MGSPVRLIQSGGKSQTLYGYDEFGNDRYGNQGELQPFGYTGYQRDKTAGSYFAQTREYLPGTGRFAGEDINKGTIMKPGSLNDYSYCLGNPLTLVDKNGRSPVPSPADAQRMMWDYCVDQYHDALDAIKDEWDSRVEDLSEYIKTEARSAMDSVEKMVDSVAEAVDSAINTGKKTWNTFLDARKSIHKLDLKIIKAITGAETINISLSGNMACVLALSGSRGFTIDSQGNIAYQYALNAGGGLPSLGVGLSIMRSSEPTYSELEGWAEMIGGSVAPGMGFGYDKVLMPNGHTASTYTIGPELNLPFTLFFEQHGEIGYTMTIWHFNVYDLLDSLKFKDAEECL